jgi:alanine-glyoxylate transaminase/serine-glyoxylate transaminase/serine-pyruvate transaminase
MNYKSGDSIGSFYPPQRTLMGPGPSEIHPRVFSAMGRPTIGYLDPVFVKMMDELKELLRYAFQTSNALTFPVSGPGSVGMEMCFVNIVSPGDKVIVCKNGVFGGRMIENVERCGGIAIVVGTKWRRRSAATRTQRYSLLSTQKRPPVSHPTPRPSRKSPTNTMPIPSSTP